LARSRHQQALAQAYKKLADAKKPVKTPTGGKRGSIAVALRAT